MKCKGLSLLETLLAIAIAGAICVAGVRFYWSSKDQSAVLQATSQIQRILKASDDWEAAERIADFSSQDSGLLTHLIDAKLLESSDESNPWGGSVSVSGNSSGQLVVRLDSMPHSSCERLVSHFKGTATSNTFSCSGKGSGSSWEGRFE